MSRLEIRLLGGFEVRRDGRPVRGFESQRVRALLAYLAAQPGRPFSREHLAELLWPEEGESAGRHNLRQALYNLRTALARGTSAGPPLVSSHHSVHFEPGEDAWIDVQVLGELLGRAQARAETDTRTLAQAVHVYRGDFLAGFFLPEGGAFEEWMLVEQDRLREAVMEALRRLVEENRQQGSYQAGIQYATKLLRIDPISEEAHRQLMLLYTCSGRRSRALETFESLVHTLDQELGVEPMAETRRLYQQILAEDLPRLQQHVPPDLAAPSIPLVGREDETRRLAEDWRRVLSGRGCLTLVVGEEGIGKTRLLRTFLADATTRHRAVVLSARAVEGWVSAAYQPLTEALESALTGDVDLTESLETTPAVEELADLVPLLPQLAEIRPELGRRQAGAAPGLDRLAAAIARLLTLAVEATRPAPRRPVILLLDDLRLADPATGALLSALAAEITDLPVWLIGAWCARDEDREEGREPPALPACPAGPIRLGRLREEDLGAVAAALLGSREAPRLAAFLFQRSAGLPLAMAEWVNLLWDLGHLAPGPEDSWCLRASDGELAALAAEDLEELIHARLQELPASVRRLLTVAAVIGARFNAGTLQRAEDEHEAVVETCLEVLLERWMVRHSLRHWADSRRERDLAQWAQGGARQGSFEFAHPAVRRAILQRLSQERLRALYRRVAGALEEEQLEGQPAPVETLADLYLRAGDWERALPWLERAAEGAAAVAPGMACEIYREALRVLDRLERSRSQGEDGGKQPARGRRSPRRRLQAALDALACQGEGAGEEAPAAGAAR